MFRPSARRAAASLLVAGLSSLVGATSSSAAVTPSDGAVFLIVKTTAGTTSERQVLATAARTVYPSDVLVSDVSLDQAWVLTRVWESATASYRTVAVSADGTTRYTYPLASTSAASPCTKDYIQTSGKFAKTGLVAGSPPALLLTYSVAHCVSGSYGPYAHRIGRATAALAPAVGTVTWQTVPRSGQAVMTATARNGYRLLWRSGHFETFTASGTTPLGTFPGSVGISLSEAGTRVLYNAGSTPGTTAYGAFLSTPSRTGVVKVSGTQLFDVQLSPDGTKAVYQVSMNTARTKHGLVAMTLSTKAKVLLDTATTTAAAPLGDALRNAQFSHDGSWVTYVRRDDVQKVLQVRRIHPGGAGREAVRGFGYLTTSWVALLR